MMAILAENVVILRILKPKILDFKNWQVFAHKTVNWSQLSEEWNRMLQYNIIISPLHVRMNIGK
jgi:hypothetical protein